MQAIDEMEQIRYTEPTMKIATILDKAITGGLLLTLLFPFVTWPFSIFPYITGKNIAFRLITEIVFILYLLVVVLNKKIKHWLSPVSAAVFAFISLLLFTALTGVNPGRSLFSNFERMEGLITFIHLAAWFVVAAGTLQDRKQWEFFFKTNLVVSAMVSAYSILQATHVLPSPQGRIAGPFGNPIYLSYYMYFNIFWGIFFLLKSKKLDWRSIGLGTLTAAQVFVLFQTATRGALLGFLFGVVITALWLIQTGKKRVWQRRSALLFLLFASLAIIAFLSLRHSNSLEKDSLPGRFAAISITNLAQDLDRVAIWKIAWQGIKQRPLLGWGLENFDAVFDRYYDPRLADRTQWFDRTHNTYLEWWLVSGIFGLLAYLGIFVAAIYTIIKSGPDSFSRLEKSVLLGLLAGYMVINFFDFDNLVSYLAFFAILAFLHAASNAEEKPPKTRAQREPQRLTVIQFVSIGLVIISGTTLIITLNRKTVHSLFMLNRAFTQQAEGFARNLEYFQKALTPRTCGQDEICRRLAEIAIKLNSADNEQIPNAVKESYFTVTYREMQRLAEREPVYARNEIAFGVFLNHFARHDEALQHLAKAHTLSPRKPAILIEKTAALLSLQRYEDALATARAAFELNPEFQESRKIYALCAICTGKQQLAESLLLPVFRTSALDDDRFIFAYSMTRQWPQVIQIFSDRLKNNPSDLDNRVGLANAFLQIGEKAKAMDQIEIAIHLNPSFKEQGLQMIQKIASYQAKEN